MWRKYFKVGRLKSITAGSTAPLFFTGLKDKELGLSLCVIELKLFKTKDSWNDIMCLPVKTRATKEVVVLSPESWEGYGLRDRTG